jgi:isoleucyl-tRNA synthetase
MPFIAEQIWQKVVGNNFQDEKMSVHLESWPGSSNMEHVTHNKIIEEMEMTRKIAEAGLAARDVAGFKIRQALQSYSTTITKELSEEMTTLIKDELNVLEIKFGKDELNTELTEELKLDGVRRELVRSINNLRKNAGLTIADRVTIYWSIGEADFAAPMAKQVFEKFGEEIKKDTLAEKVIHEHNHEVTQAKEIKINGETVWLGIVKL